MIPNDDELKEQIKKLAEEISGSFWDYRWIKTVENYELDGIECTDTHYSLHEVYYDDFEKPFMYTDSPTRFRFYDHSDMMDTIEAALVAAKEKPLLQEINGKLVELDEYLGGE